MPRRKQTTIKLDELDIYPALVEELRHHPAYSDKDIATLKLTILENYTATIRDIDKAITHLQHYVAAKKNSIDTFGEEQLINRTQLAKMLGISRPTLIGWIRKGFVTPLKFRYRPEVEVFNTDAVLQELQRHKANRSGERL